MPEVEAMDVKAAKAKEVADLIEQLRDAAEITGDDLLQDALTVVQSQSTALSTLSRELAEARAERDAVVAVKPLEWTDGASMGGCYAVNAIATYFAYLDGSWTGPARHTVVTNGTLDEAKAACQADYEARIRSALAKENDHG